MPSTCKCPCCGAALQLNVASSGPHETKSPLHKAMTTPLPFSGKPVKTKFGSSNTGRLRACLQSIGMSPEVTIFNDRGALRRDGTQQRRLKIWTHQTFTDARIEQLAAACRKEFGDDLIKAGYVEETGFCVVLHV